MSKKPDRIPTSVPAAAAVSLVAAVACALASEAQASRLPTELNVGGSGLSTRVAAIAERVRASDTTFLSRVPSEPKMAWRN
jgi:hypothetical protein